MPTVIPAAPTLIPLLLPKDRNLGCSRPASAQIPRRYAPRNDKRPSQESSPVTFIQYYVPGW